MGPFCGADQAQGLTNLLALQLSLEFLDLLQNPWVVGGMLDRFLFRPPPAAYPIDEGAKQPHVGIRVFQYLRGPTTRLENHWKPGLDDRKALR